MKVQFFIFGVLFLSTAFTRLTKQVFICFQYFSLFILRKHGMIFAYITFISISICVNFSDFSVFWGHIN